MAILRRRKPGRRDGPPATSGQAGAPAWPGVDPDRPPPQLLAEELSAAAELHYKTLVETLPTVIYERERGRDAPWHYVGPRIAQLTGVSPEEWIADPTMWSSRLHPDDRERVLGAINRAAPDQVLTLEYRLLHRHGHLVWVRDEAELMVDDGRPPYLRGTISDVSGLHEIAERHQDLLEQLPAVAYQSEAGYDGRWLYVSPQIERLLGYTARQWMADQTLWESRLHPEDRDQILRRDEAARRHGVGADDEAWEYRMIHRDGRVVWIRDHGRLHENPSGGLPLWRGVMIDVTAQREGEQDLVEAHERYRALVELLPAVVYRWERRGGEERCDYISPQIEELLGHPPSAWLKDPQLWPSSIHPDDRERILKQVEEAWTAQPGTRLTLKYRMVHRDGHAIPVRDEATVNVSDEGRFLDGLVFEDEDESN
jgi:PAS domain S-box-containing protein